jgi:hypothetical protein
MNVNPFIKFQIDCPVSAEEAYHRITSVTRVLKAFVPDCGLFHGDGSPRYVGKLTREKFRLRTRPQLSIPALFFHLNRQIVIHGRIEPRGPRCLIKVLIRPLSNILLGIPLGVVGLMLLMERIIDGSADLIDWVFLGFFAVWVYTSVYFYSSVSAIERSFLESFLRAPPTVSSEARYSSLKQLTK